MTVYFDSSVVLRVVFAQPEQLDGWARIGDAIASVLLHVECFRAFDRVRLSPSRQPEVLDRYRIALPVVLEHVKLILVNDSILARAAQPWPFTIGTLDAIHLATAMEWRDQNREPLTFATHDAQLGAAARHVGFDVLGL